MSRRSRALAIAGLSVTLLGATGCAHAGVSVRSPEADNTDLPRSGIVRLVYPHATQKAPPVVEQPDLVR